MSTSNSQRRIVIGVGNAGVAVLDRIAVENPGLKELIVINNDSESLAASVVANRITLPQGEKADGFLAIKEEFGAAIRGAASVIFCGGLGGEMGSFLLPALAARTKSDGITTLATVGIPFAFEGRQKRESANAALKKLHGLCDAVAVIDNDMLSGGTPSTAAVGASFAAADRTLQSSLRALQGMLLTNGPVKITRNDLAAVLGGHGGATHFGHGRAKGPNRLHEAWEETLKSPLLILPGKGGSSLKQASAALLLLRGPSDLSFAEVQRAVTEVERIAGDRCQVKVGVLAEGESGGLLEIFLMTSSAGAARSKEQASELPLAIPQPAPLPTHVGAEVKTVPRSETSKAKPAKINIGKQTQGVLNLESYQRGRFDKSEPTIVAGQDLDIPTFIRKGIKLPLPHRT